VSVKQTKGNGKVGDGTPGPGRRKGVPNKITADVKAMVLGALEKSHKDGGVGYLVEQSEKNPVAFMGLVGKVLPLTLAGDADNPVSLSLAVTLVRKPD
jgi:hypothetical protein